MSGSDTRNEARLYFLPIILGNGRQAHRTSALLFSRFGIVSHIFSQKRSLLDLIDPCSRHVKLISLHDSLVCEQLCTIASERPYNLALLIPTTEELELFVKRNQSSLEPHFLICSADTSSDRHPASIIRRTYSDERR